MKITIGNHVELKGLTDEQYHTFCQKAIKDGANRYEYNPEETFSNDWKHVGVDEHNDIMHYSEYFLDNYPHMLLTIDQALSDDEEEQDEVIDAVNEMREVNSEIENLFNRKAELEKIICDGLDIS